MLPPKGVWEPLLSVSIVTYQVQEAAFAQVLASVQAALDRLIAAEDCQVEVVIIDNADQAALLQSLAEGHAGERCHYRVLGRHGNLGYGRGHNMAIEASTARYHLVLNPDVLLDEHCLTEGLAWLRGHPGTSAVAPFAVDEEGRAQYLCKQFPTVLDLVLRGFAPPPLRRLFSSRLASYELRDLVDSRRTGEVQLISGCFMLCDTRKLKQAGGFDKGYFLYFEDYALSMELRKLGPLVFLPAMKIRHDGGNSATKGLRHIRLFIQSGIRFFNTYGWRLI